MLRTRRYFYVVTSACFFCMSNSYSCFIERVQTIPLATCPDYTIEENLVVEGNLCITTGTTTIDNNLIVAGTGTICTPSCAADFLTTTTCLLASPIQSAQYNRLGLYEVMKSNRELAPELTLHAQCSPNNSTNRSIFTATSHDGSIVALLSADEQNSPTPSFVYIDIFRRKATVASDQWSLDQTLTFTHAFEPLSIAISDDGSVITAGVGTLPPGLGSSSGNVIIARYHEVTDTWLVEQILNQQPEDPLLLFGNSVAITADGNCIAVGNLSLAPPPIGPPSGTVALYRWQEPCATSPAWVLEQLINPGSPLAFGRSVALSPEGSYLLVGAPTGTTGANASSAFLYQHTTSWQLLQTITPNLTSTAMGFSVALAEGARYAMIGGLLLQNATTPIGTVTAFYELSHNGLLSLQALFNDSTPINNGPNFSFPRTILSTDGTTAMSFFRTFKISPPNDQQIFLFKRFNTTWQRTTVHHPITPTSPPPFTIATFSRDGSVMIASVQHNSLIDNFIYYADYDLVPTDLLITSSVCMEQVVTVTGSLFVTGTITHGGTLASESIMYPDSIALLIAQINALAVRQSTLQQLG